MSEHTPGPWNDGPPAWFKGRRNPEDGKRPINGPPGTATVANVYGSANARLITAAPELLEALSDLLDASTSDFGFPDEGDEDDEPTATGENGWKSAITFGHLRRAQEAISKATNPQHKAKA